MPTRAAEPSLPADAMSPGDTILTHDPATAQQYRDAAARADQRRQAIGGTIQQPSAAPDTAPLPSPMVARQCLGHELSRLSMKAESLQRQAEANPFAFAGNANPYLAQVDQAQQGMREQARAELARVRAELARLEALALDDHGAQLWARDHQAITPGRIRTN